MPITDEMASLLLGEIDHQIKKLEDCSKRVETASNTINKLSAAGFLEIQTALQTAANKITGAASDALANLEASASGRNEKLFQEAAVRVNQFREKIARDELALSKKVFIEIQQQIEAAGFKIVEEAGAGGMKLAAQNLLVAAQRLDESTSRVADQLQTAATRFEGQLDTVAKRVEQKAIGAANAREAAFSQNLVLAVVVSAAIGGMIAALVVKIMG